MCKPRRTLSVVVLTLGIVNTGATEAAAKTIVVKTTIQAAIDEAAPGDTIQVPPRGLPGEPAGCQRSLDDPRKCRCCPRRQRARRDNWHPRVVKPARRSHQRVHSRRADDPQLQPDRRSAAADLTEYPLIGTRYEQNHEYGPFPIFSTDGLSIASNHVSGSDDACIYIGRSSNAVIRDNIIEDCLTGIQVENSERIEVSHNLVRESSLGIVTLIVPGAPLPAVRDVTIRDNVLMRNNRPNEVTDPLCRCSPPA